VGGSEHGGDVVVGQIGIGAVVEAILHLGLDGCGVEGDGVVRDGARAALFGVGGQGAPGHQLAQPGQAAVDGDTGVLVVGVGLLGVDAQLVDGPVVTDRVGPEGELLFDVADL